MPSSYSTLLSEPPVVKASLRRKQKESPCCSYVAVRMAWCIHLQTTTHYRGYNSVEPGLVALRLRLPLFSFAGRVALEPPDSRSSTGYPITPPYSDLVCLAVRS